MAEPGSEQRPTRELILEEAVRCFAENGYEGTSLNDIAAGVGIRRQSLLHHFPSKEALYGEAFELLLSDWFARLEVAIASPGTGRTKVELVIKAGFDLFAGNPDYVRMMRREALDGGVHLGIDLSAVLRPMFERAANWTLREMDAGVLRRQDHEHLVLMAYGAILSYFSDAPFLAGLVDGDPLGPEQMARARANITAVFLAALDPATAGS
jgi:TetR/AcrR family transcriptional regulator